MSASPLPYKRWFLWLLVSVVLTLLDPYLFHHQNSRFYDPSIGTFIQISQGFTPTPEHVWLDGRTAAQLGATSWLYFGLVVVAAEALWRLLQVALAKRRMLSASAHPA